MLKKYGLLVGILKEDSISYKVTRTSISYLQERNGILNRFICGLVWYIHHVLAEFHCSRSHIYIEIYVYISGISIATNNCICCRPRTSCQPSHHLVSNHWLLKIEVQNMINLRYVHGLSVSLFCTTRLCQQNERSTPDDSVFYVSKVCIATHRQHCTIRRY